MVSVKGLWTSPTSPNAAKVVACLEENVFGPYTHHPLPGLLEQLCEIEHDLHEALGGG